MSESHKVYNRKSSFDSFSSKTSFWLGLGSGVGSLLIIGFFILLVVVLTGGGGSSGKEPVASNSGGNTRPSVTAPAPPTQPSASTAPSVQLAEVTDDDHIRGAVDAPITIIEYSDFECPFCNRFHPTMQQIMNEYEGQVRWIYRHFPLTSIHPEAQSAAEASECAFEQGGNRVFWAYGDALFENQQRLGSSLYTELAGELGLNVGDFESCLDEGRYAQKVQDQYQSGLSAGVRGTPGSFINGQPIPGAVPYEQVKAAVESLL